jgi:hypothetical protein
MTGNEEARRDGVATGLGDAVCLATNGSPNSKPSPAAQAAIAALRRDFDVGAARLEAIRYAWAASVKLRHLGENLALNDDVTAVRDRQLARENWAGMALALERLDAALAANAERRA